MTRTSTLLAASVAALLLALTALAGCGGKEEVPPPLTEVEKELIAVNPDLMSVRDLFRHALKIDEHITTKLDKDAATARSAQRKAALDKEAVDASAEAASEGGVAVTDAQKAARQAAAEALEIADKAYKPFADRRAALRKAQRRFLNKLAGQLEGSSESSAIYAQFKRGDCVSSTTARLRSLWGAIRNIQDKPDQFARAEAQRLGVIVADGADGAAVHKTLAAEMNATITNFFATWSVAKVLDENGIDATIEEVIRPYVVFKQANDLNMIQPYKPVNPSQLKQLNAQLEAFSLRYPAGKVAGELGKGDESDLINRIGQPDGDGLAEKGLVQMIVNDLYDAYGDEGADLQPVKSFRVAMVRLYSNETGLTNPEPVALLIAIIGSIVLFGGLALAIFRAVRGGRPVDLGPTT